ncbi:amidohydrolase family protein [Candidatus Woesearchaeota archaeon]|nr:amidohydrolase family protein [Candidatus Woesearchaeota archaeon]
MRLLIKNSNVFCNGNLEKANILCDNGMIQEISLKEHESDEVIDASGLIAIPGVIDPHVHCRDLKQSQKEDFYTASMAAAKGGITTMLAMPNTDPPIIDSASLAKAREAGKKSIVNYGFYVAGIEGNYTQIGQCRNIAGIKVYMNDTTGNLKVTSNNELRKLFSSCKRVAVHAEGKKVEEAISLINSTSNSLYLAHISAKEEISAIRKLGTKKVFCEVTPHHLYLSKDDLKKLGPFGMMKPPLKDRQDIGALWEALSDGTIDTVGTDHAPHIIAEKMSENVPFGVPGLETMLPLLLHAVSNNRLTIRRLVEITSQNAARIFGIKGKGSIIKGHDADITLIDMGLQKEVRNDELLTKCGWSPFDGYSLQGWPVITIVGGNVVFKDGKIENAYKGKEVSFSDEQRDIKGAS